MENQTVIVRDGVIERIGNSGDVANVSKRAGVMLRGQWLPEAQLRGMLDKLVDSYTPPFIERVWPASLIALGVFLILRRLI